MSTLFLSYSRGDDEPFVPRIYEALTARGFDVWFDRVSMPNRELTFLHETRGMLQAAENLLNRRQRRERRLFVHGLR